MAPPAEYQPLWDPDLAAPLEVGIDAVEVDRIRALLERFGDRFLMRVYTEAERERYGRRPAELAARFAAKEAVMKALGTGTIGIGWHDVEVLPNARGKPVLLLDGGARRRAQELGLTQFAISLTHSRTDAIAIVIASRENPSGRTRP